MSGKEPKPTNYSPDSEVSSKDENSLPAAVEDAALQEVLQDVPADARKIIIQAFRQSESHSGWLPTPKYLQEYEAILPGLAERIVALPEREQAHRHRVIEKSLADDGKLRLRTH